ncbi:MAG: hypothetical protein HN731_00795 [Rhodospirillaceae bacterium]|jgi:hypothetical protein|nr:hypothetical protein [Rhodospirillaceae bacterium]
MRLIQFSVLLFITSSGPAYAYVDPGSGAFMLQILAALGVGLLFYFRRFKDFIKSLLPNHFTASTKDDNEKIE